MPSPLRSDVLARGVAADIRGMEANALAALVPVMREAERELAADLAGWLARLGPRAAELRFTAAHLRHVQLLLGVAQGQAALRRGGFPRAAQAAVLSVMGQQQAPRRAALTVVDQLEQIRAFFDDLPPPQLLHAAVLAQGNRMVVDRFPGSARRYGGQVRQDLQRQFGVGLARGESVQRLISRIANVSTFRAAVDASHPQHAGGAMAAGLRARYQHWANRLVRTELVNAYNYTAHRGVLAAHAMDGRVVMRWDATNDLRVCQRCRDMHGRVASPAVGFRSVVYPPLHPQCRCSVVAWMEEWGEGPEAASGGDAPREERARALEAHAENEREAGRRRREAERELRAARRGRGT